jgi:hypothetical protein
MSWRNGDKKLSPLLKQGKGIQLQAWTGHEVSRRVGSQISRQSSHEGDKVVSPTHWPHLPPPPPENIPGTHFSSVEILIHINS